MDSAFFGRSGLNSRHFHSLALPLFSHSFSFPIFFFPFFSSSFLISFLPSFSSDIFHQASWYLSQTSSRRHFCTTHHQCVVTEIFYVLKYWSRHIPLYNKIFIFKTFLSCGPIEDQTGFISEGNFLTSFSRKTQPHAFNL